MADRVSVAILGSGFAADLHASAFSRVPGADVVAVCSPNAEHARTFAGRHAIPRWETDHSVLLREVDCSAVVLATPNSLHKTLGIDALLAGRDLICEKPLAGSVADAKELVDSAARLGRRIFYAEQLVHAPAYRRVFELIRGGSIGSPFFIRHRGAHSGPHSRWFYDSAAAQGGVMLDMSSHGVELVRFLYGKPRPSSVYAFARTVRHSGITHLEDDAMVALDFGEERRAVVESSWAQLGGLCDRLEVYGTAGHLIVDLSPGPAVLGFSQTGFGYAAEKASVAPGWTPIAVDELTDLGYVAQAASIVGSLLSGQAPAETGEDGVRVLEILEAAYTSAAAGEVVRFEE